MTDRGQAAVETDGASSVRLVSQLRILDEVTLRIASAEDPANVVQVFLGSLDRLVTFRSARVYLYDQQWTSSAGSLAPVRVTRQRIARLRAGRTAADREMNLLFGSPPPANGVVLTALHTGSARYQGLPDGGEECAVPLHVDGEPLGALSLDLDAALSAQDHDIMERLAAHAAVVLRRALLLQETQRLATIDPLTEVSNYRQFHATLELEVERARRLGYPLGLIVLDLDFFKLINDRHGHPVGDLALRGVATLLRTRLRRTDVIGRLGGEEFGIILPGVTLPDVGKVCEKLRRSIESMRPVRGGMDSTPTPVTISAGGTSQNPDELDARTLVDWADRGLYRAKRDGRNRYRLWHDGQMLTVPDA